jgi:hypothetical protein
LVVQYTHVPSKLASAPFTTLGVNAGSKAQVSDEMGLWIGDQAYAPGGFGFVGGTPTMFDKDLAITNTSEPPLYFTFPERDVGVSVRRAGWLVRGDADVRGTVGQAGRAVFGVSVNGYRRGVAPRSLGNTWHRPRGDVYTASGLREWWCGHHSELHSHSGSGDSQCDSCSSEVEIKQSLGRCRSVGTTIQVSSRA